MWLLIRHWLVATTPKITKTAVDNLTPEGDAPSFLWDRSLPGFGVKCTPRGAKKYVVKYRANGGGRSASQRWLTLGGHGQLTPDQARKMAQQALAAVARGEDPQGAKMKRRGAPSLGDLWKRYESEHLPSCKPQTRRDYEAQWANRLKPKFGNIAVHEVSRSDVDKLHKSLRATPYQANRAVALLSRLLNLAEAWDLRPQGSNPCRHVERFAEKPRTRFLNLNEMKTLGETMELMISEKTLSSSAANAIRLLLLTGARLSEILAAEWSWFDSKLRIIALPDSKSGAKPLYLSEAAITVLNQQRKITGTGRVMFTGTGKDGRMINLRKPWMRVCERASLEGVRLHDLRHTAASVAVSQGASLPIIGRLLGHSQAQTTQRYAHVDSDPALLAANAVGKVMQGPLKVGRKWSTPAKHSLVRQADKQT